AGLIALCLLTRTDELPTKRVPSIWETLSHATGHRTERTMRKTRNALLGILTMMSGAILAVPTEAAERYIPSVHLYKAAPERLFSYPYGGTHLRVDYGSAPTTVVTTPPGTTTATALPTIGNAAATAAVLFTLGPPDWLKMKNADAPAVKRE